MSKHFPAIVERRYAQHPRRYLNEYCWSRESWNKASAKGRIATLASAKKHAVAAIEVWGYTAVRIFDTMKGEYVKTYKRSSEGISIHEGMVK
jgi:hypothetical protein